MLIWKILIYMIGFESRLSGYYHDSNPHSWKQIKKSNRTRIHNVIIGPHLHVILIELKRLVVSITILITWKWSMNSIDIVWCIINEAPSNRKLHLWFVSPVQHTEVGFILTWLLLHCLSGRSKACSLIDGCVTVAQACSRCAT